MENYIDLIVLLAGGYLFFRREKFFVTPELLAKVRREIENEVQLKYATVQAWNYLHEEIKDLKDTTKKIYEHLLNH